MHVTTDDGVRLHVQTSGDGPQKVLVPNGMFLAKDFAPLAADRTLIFFDVRDRGLSDTTKDPARLARGIHNDVDDLDAVRRHFGSEKAAVIGHSYVGVTVALYAMRYPQHTERVIQIGPPAPDPAKQYPPELSNNDGLLPQVFAQLGQLNQNPPEDPVERCRAFWKLLAPIFVYDPAHVAKIDWGRCELENERNFMRHFGTYIQPSLAGLKLTAEDLAKAVAPVLTIHGDKDRSAPFGGGREWASLLPNARLLTLQNVAHAPWLEAPEETFGAIDDFLNGSWPSAALVPTS
jgi:proline iminopeptidase